MAQGLHCHNYGHGVHAKMLNNGNDEEEDGLHSTVDLSLKDGLI